MRVAGKYGSSAKNTITTRGRIHMTTRKTPKSTPVAVSPTEEHAIAFAETGHLCLGTLHANNANQAIDRIINFFPEERRNQLLMDLSSNMRAIISQRLVRTADVDRDNRVASTRVADAQIAYTGKGDVARAGRQGWLSRFFQVVSPF
jgi:type IV secretory pathway ATPase VirB11/archaellum biosynthesis ATPase